MTEGETVRQDLVSILICSRDRRKALEALIKGLMVMETAYAFEVVVVEETDHPLPIEGTTYVPHPVANRGIPFARNLALAHAKGDMLVFLDDDCVIHDQWLNKLLEPFEDETVVGVQGGVTVPPDTNATGWVETLLGFPGGGIRRVLEAKGDHRETLEISTLNGAYRRWVVDEVGGFEKRLKLTGEDYILAKQACRYGRCLFVPEAMVSHDARGSLIQIWRWFVRRGRAEVDVIRTGAQQETTLWTLLKGSLTLKWCALLIVALAFTDWALPLVLIALLAFMGLQYVRYYAAWKASPAPFMALILLPGVKFWMDTAVDWGRFRGVLFD